MVGCDIVTRYVNKKNTSLIVHGKDETDNELIKFFKEVCLRDGLEMRRELLDLLRHSWATKHNWPKGNPQQQVTEYFESHEESTAVCEVCKEPAVYKCTTIFPINTVKDLCQSHTVQFERRREVIKKVKL